MSQIIPACRNQQKKDLKTYKPARITTEIEQNNYEITITEEPNRNLVDKITEDVQIKNEMQSVQKLAMSVGIVDISNGLIMYVEKN